MPEQTAEQRIFNSLNPADPPKGDTDEGAAIIDPEAKPKETPPSDTDTEMYKVNPNGEEMEVSLEELKKGYMRNHDYQKKLTGTRKQRETHEALEQSLSTTLTDAKGLIEFELKEIEADSELKDVDPEEYWRRIDTVKTKAEKWQKLKAKEQERLTEKQRKRLEKEAEKLNESVPDWLDPEVKEKEQADIVNMLSTSGYSNDEISGLGDHRVFLLARKAMLYDKIQSQDIQAKKVKKVPKTATPSSNRDPAPNATKKTARSRLQETGKMNDAAAAIRELFNKGA